MRVPLAGLTNGRVPHGFPRYIVAFLCKTPRRPLWPYAMTCRDNSRDVFFLRSTVASERRLSKRDFSSTPVSGSITNIDTSDIRPENIARVYRSACNCFRLFHSGEHLHLVLFSDNGLSCIDFCNLYPSSISQDGRMIDSALKECGRSNPVFFLADTGRLTEASHVLSSSIGIEASGNVVGRDFLGGTGGKLARFEHAAMHCSPKPRVHRCPVALRIRD